MVLSRHEKSRPKAAPKSGDVDSVQADRMDEQVGEEEDGDGRRGPTATYLQALISLAAAGLKARSGSACGMRANEGKAARLFKSVASHAGSQGTRFMGLDGCARRRRVHNLEVTAD
jgi:hypothetical protein